MRNINKMKKYLLTLLLSLTMLNGCSYWHKADLSWMNPFSAKEEEVKQTQTAKPAVNEFLWQAALDKTAFMPKLEVNGNTGKIMTDWVDSGNAQYRLDIRINCKELRADGVEVRGYKKVFENGRMTEKPLSISMNRAIEQAILARARVLYASSLAN